MTAFSSNSVTIPYSRERVFAFLSNLNNLDGCRKYLSGLSVKDLRYDKDSCQFNTEGVGKIALRIVERQPFNTIRILSESSPVSFAGSIILDEAGPEQTLLKLTLDADIPLILKPLLVKPLEKGIIKAAEALGTLPY